MKKRIVNAVICAAFLAALAGGQIFGSSLPANAPEQDKQQVAEASDVVDDIEDDIVVEGDTLIPDQDVPLAPSSSSKTKVTTKKTHKSYSKTKKLSKASGSSKTVTRKTTRRQKKSSVQPAQMVVTDTTTITTEKSKYQRGSYKVKVTTDINQTIKTTTTPKESAKKDIRKVATKADSKLLSRFVNEGFEYYINTGCDTVGVFSPSRKRIELRYQSDVVYHELGHYLAYTTGKRDLTDEFADIFAAEKKKYTASNKDYVTQNVREYFAESYRDYVTGKSALKKARPKTYKYIQATLKML